MVKPVAGLMMGIALRPRVAAGWCSFVLCCVWNVGGTNGGDDELREKLGATVCGCWVGEDCGELLANEERSEALDIETKSVSVNRPGQNSMSSSRSKERLVSNLVRKAERAAVSLSSFMPRRRSCLWEFWETVMRGALRLRPPWWP
jgi:hypothetical protein